MGSKRPAKKAKDLSPKAGGVKGGGGVGNDKIATNDNVTLVRFAKPTAKKKDLSPKSSGGVKGGGKRLNDSTTLIRGAKPTAKKKDLPARKDVTGGKKRD